MECMSRRITAARPYSAYRIQYPIPAFKCLMKLDGPHAPHLSKGVEGFGGIDLQAEEEASPIEVRGLASWARSIPIGFLTGDKISLSGLVGRGESEMSALSACDATPFAMVPGGWVRGGIGGGGVRRELTTSKDADGRIRGAGGADISVVKLSVSSTCSRSALCRRSRVVSLLPSS